MEVNRPVNRSPAGPARGDFHHKDSVAIVQGLAQGIFQFLRRQAQYALPRSLAQFLVELRLAMMGEHLANKNVQLRLHRQDSSA